MMHLSLKKQGLYNRLYDITDKKRNGEINKPIIIKKYGATSIALIFANAKIQYDTKHINTLNEYVFFNLSPFIKAVKHINIYTINGKEYHIALLEITVLVKNPKNTTIAKNIAIAIKKYIEYILMNKSYKVGHSFDFHTVVKNRKLILGGVKFDTDFGLLGHSDADVVYHAVTEAILGALSLGDIGTHFPDTDSKYLNMDSSYFVKEAVKLLEKENYTIENIDIIIYLEEPNLKNYKVQMAKNIKQLTNASYVNVKATTLEKKGPIGAKEGIASEAVILIKK